MIGLLARLLCQTVESKSLSPRLTSALPADQMSFGRMGLRLNAPEEGGGPTCGFVRAGL